MPNKRLEISVQGTVQGVGFRPCAYAIAKKQRLTGFVCNQGNGVIIEIQGSQIDDYVNQLKQALPSLAVIKHISVKEIPPLAQEANFTIKPSQTDKGNTLIAPDTNLCDNCLEDLFDQHSRYYHYPFTNCSQCGPRFTITKTLPYDRCHTSMGKFPLCGQCQREYDNPNNRRHHAQPIACPDCGPSYSISIATMVNRIIAGDILAIKSLGGYQLVCDASNSETIDKLRQRKNRPAKPFAIMVSDLDAAKHYVHINDLESQQLISAARPIVLLDRCNSLLANNLAANLNQLGVMLPSNPCHYLIFDQLKLKDKQDMALVVTSANCSGEPIIAEDQKAQLYLANIADAIVPHNRNIVARVDDSVVRVIDSKPVFIRRARGFVPKPISLAKPLPSIVALGGQQKNTLCFVRDDQAFVSQYLGSVTSHESIDFFEQTFNHWLELLNIKPEYIAHDCHPDFFTSQWANQQALPNLAIQHHHAHLASVMAEQKFAMPCLGLALDGYGYGPQGQAWGGELMRLEGAYYQHLSQLAPLAFVGGEQAVRQPWRMAAAALHQLGRGEDSLKKFDHMPLAKPLLELMDKQPNLPTTSSAGRLFDAAAALLGICLHSSYEGQAAMQLESLVSHPIVMPSGWQFDDNHLSFLPLLNFLADSPDQQTGANLFHGTLIVGLADWIGYHCQRHQVSNVILSGGCFANGVLTSGLAKALRQKNINAHLPKQMPCNDGGLSLGQAWVAGLRVS